MQILIITGLPKALFLKKVETHSRASLPFSIFNPLPLRRVINHPAVMFLLLTPALVKHC